MLHTSVQATILPLPLGEGYNLLVELDGPIHDADEVQLRDRHRQERLRQLGFNLLRIPNRVVIKNTKDFLNALEERIEKLKSWPHTQLSPQTSL